MENDLLSVSILNKIINSLTDKRKFFFSEADFQHELAWEIRKNLDCKVYLEMPINTTIDYQRYYIDLVIEINSILIAFELKYKTKKATIQFNNTIYTLGNQAATNLARYDYLKDIMRLEILQSENKINKGYAIFLTNDSSYWNDNRKYNKTGPEFYFSNGMIISGEKKWSAGTNMNGIGERKKPIYLNKKYSANWMNYSKIDNYIFNYLICEV